MTSSRGRKLSARSPGRATPISQSVRPGMPGRDVELDQAVARHAEADVVLERWPEAVGEVGGRRHADQPVLAAERAQALGDLAVARDALEGDADLGQAHDPDARLAV